MQFPNVTGYFTMVVKKEENGNIVHFLASNKKPITLKEYFDSVFENKLSIVLTKINDHSVPRLENQGMIDMVNKIVTLAPLAFGAYSSKLH